MHRRITWLGVLAFLVSGCAEEPDSADECMSNGDCPDGQVCVVSHDHEGDDHDHGGSCEEPDTGGS